MAVKVFHRDESEVRLPLIAADARLVVWPGVGAWTANMSYVRMVPGEENVPHAHAESEDTIYVLSGETTVRDLDHGTEDVVRSGRGLHPGRPASPGRRRLRGRRGERRRPVPGRPRGAARRRAPGRGRRVSRSATVGLARRGAVAGQPRPGVHRVRVPGGQQPRIRFPRFLASVRPLRKTIEGPL